MPDLHLEAAPTNTTAAERAARPPRRARTRTMGRPPRTPLEAAPSHLAALSRAEVLERLADIRARWVGHTGPGRPAMSDERRGLVLAARNLDPPLSLREIGEVLAISVPNVSRIAHGK